jgi:hypothetical protein
VILEFAKPEDARRLRLVANLATGLWGSHMIRELLSMRGRDLEAFYASIDGDPTSAQALRAWNLREELYALKVEVEETGGFVVRGVLPGGGPFIAEDRVLSLDVSRVRGDRVRLRVRPPAGFWALNSFAADYADDQPVQVTTVRPSRAWEDGGRDRLSDLLAGDDRYYDMPRTGDRGYVTFPAPPSVPGLARTVLLHSRGYYRLHLPLGGDPQTEALNQIAAVPGAPLRLAASRYAEWQAARTAQR